MGTHMATTVGMSAGHILAAADITAAVDMSAVEFVAVAGDTLAVAVAEDTPVVVTVATGRCQETPLS
jgi:hypothetical protein